MQIGAVMAALTLLTLDYHLPGGLIDGTEDLDTARTAAFTVLVLAQLFNCLNARSETVSAFRQLFVNGWLWGAIALSVVLQVAVVHVPLLNVAFDTVPLTAAQWFFCVLAGSGVLVFRAAQARLARPGALSALEHLFKVGVVLPREDHLHRTNIGRSVNPQSVILDMVASFEEVRECGQRHGRLCT